MIRIELTGRQKVQISVVVLALCLTVYVLARNGRPNLDQAVNGWSYPQKQQKDPTKPAGPNNPWDPKKESMVSLFTCYDGQLEIREYRNDSSKRATLAWVKLDPRHQQHIYYHDPMAPIYEKKDPYDHAIALAAYSAAEGHSLGLMTNAALTADQLAAEKKARSEMMAAIGVHDLSVENGEFHFDMMETLMTALNEYRRAPGNPMEDAEKAARARDVLADASAFMEKVNAEKSGIIEKYIGKLNDILTKDQKAKVVLSAKAYESQHTKLTGSTPVQPKAAAKPTPKPAPPKPPQPKPATAPG